LTICRHSIEKNIQLRGKVMLSNDNNPFQVLKVHMSIWTHVLAYQCIFSIWKISKCFRKLVALWWRQSLPINCEHCWCSGKIHLQHWKSLAFTERPQVYPHLLLSFILMSTLWGKHYCPPFVGNKFLWGQVILPKVT
jgi:hypothetical protein